MNKVREFWKEFWNDGYDYYGDIKACLVYLTFCISQIVLVIVVYEWMDKL